MTKVLLVTEVLEGGEAWRIGLKNLDHILSVGGVRISTPDEFSEVLASASLPCELEVEKDGEISLLTLSEKKLGIQFRFRDLSEGEWLYELLQKTSARENLEWVSKPIILTTTDSVPGREITGVCSILSAGASFLIEGAFTDRIAASDGFAGVKFSTRMWVLKKELEAQARALRADAVVGVTFGLGGANKQAGIGVFVTFATGTAVTLAPIDLVGR